MSQGFFHVHTSIITGFCFSRILIVLLTLYYRCKPFVPRRIRLFLRQMHAKRILRNCEDFWPIQESAGRKPCGWPGWPDGRRFALVLTHNVEGQRGLAGVKQLAELEMELGFRSSFSFVPEGEYTVPAALCTWLTDRGFEVGVHDLHHDGFLFSSSKGFRRKAQKINNYLEEWNAVGFRSAFMLRNLEWIQELNIRYDASTFDTDPVEPQPFGVETIYPFYIEGTNGQEGYVELPYTLPQDFTLLLLLKHPKFRRIWQEKLSWISKCGGMALVNVHPDYIAFDAKAPSFCTYPASRYVEFLSWVKKEYAGEYWQVQPAEMARFIRSIALTKDRPDQRIPASTDAGVGTAFFR
jgi:hypothetical protein